MPLAPETSSEFGGLRLDVPLDAVPSTQAVDLLDVDWGAGLGDLEPRMGASQWSEKRSLYNQLYRVTIGDPFFLTRRENTLVALNSLGKEAATTGAPGNPTLTFARLGTPSSSFAYIGMGSSEAIKRFDGSSFTSPKIELDKVAGKRMPFARALATWPDGGNRLVVCGVQGETFEGASGPGGVTSSGSHVWFSEPGNAEAFESSAYVQLSPGDGETIGGCCQWNGQIFVTKRTKLFVFYGVDTGEEGKPIFNYRTVEIPGSEILTQKFFSGPMMVPGEEGVYFVTDHGVYLTNGGQAVKVSGVLEGLRENVNYDGPAMSTFEGEGRRLSWMDATSIERVGSRLFIPLYTLSPVEAKAPEPAISRVLVYDIARDAWLVWSGKVRGFGVGIQEGGEEPHLYFSAFGGGIYRYDPDLTEDAHLEMEPRWQSGFYDLGSDNEVTFTQARVYGSGEVTVKTAKDFGELGKGKSFNLSKGSAEQQRTQTGRLHSHHFSGKSPWKVRRFTRYLETARASDTSTRG